MKSRGWVFLVSVFLVLSITLGWLYQYSGLKYYIRAISLIKKMPVELQVTANEKFYALGDGDYYSGILAGVWNGNVWIWERGQLKHYLTDEYSVYSFLDDCNEEILNPSERKTTRSIKSEVFIDLAEWKQRANTGDFVTIKLAGVDSGGALGNLREIWAYNWWTFLQKDMKTACAK